MGPVSKPKNALPTIKRLLHYVSDFKFHIIFVIFCMLLSTVTSLIGSYMLFPIINRIAQVETTIEDGAIAVKVDGLLEKLRDKMFPLLESLFENDRHADITVYVITALAILLLVYLVGIIASYLQHRVMLSVTQGALERIRNDLFAKLQKLPVRYFDTHPTGEVMSRFTNDVDTIGVMFDTSLLSIISGVITLVGTFVFMVTTNWILTIVTVVFIPIFITGGKMLTSRSRKFFSAQQAALGAVNGYIEESVSGQKVIKVFNREDECVAEFEALNQDLRDKQFKAQFIGGIMGPVMGNTGQISYAVTLGVGGVMMATSGFTPGALTVFAQYSRQFSFPINNISQQINTIFSALAGAERVFAVMDSEPEAPIPADAICDPIEGEVVFDNVTFGYDPDKVVLKNISLYAKKGQKIAFVGSTGAGKTTVTNLLNRFYDIEQGEITVDGKPLKAYDRSYLRKNIAMVLQDTHLFTDTVMENIRYGRLDATDEEVIAAAKTASAHSFITRLADGYNTVLEGDGANLSQGQRQLINIARAALSKAPILVLDEATSSVDTRTERHIEKGMDRLMSNRTTFVIAHRLSTVRNSNAIMVLEKGEIIERGTHQQLLDLKGRYYELYTGMKELD
ncbi:MAG: ABC transporter ATP-binding protein [Clostridia bacterium]|nr:ABC transporter ATP-binding protein [Clostridia bacterium]